MHHLVFVIIFLLGSVITNQRQQVSSRTIKRKLLKYYIIYNRAYTRGDRRRNRSERSSRRSSRATVAPCIHYRRPVGATIAPTVAATIAPCTVYVL